MTKKTDDYKCGWNDTEYGVNNWSGNTEEWQNPIQWANGMKDIAIACKKTHHAQRQQDYYQGVIDCVEQYLKTGVVSRMERGQSWQ